jgi:hypothetical protein
MSNYLKPDLILPTIATTEQQLAYLTTTCHEHATQIAWLIEEIKARRQQNRRHSDKLEALKPRQPLR